MMSSGSTRKPGNDRRGPQEKTSAPEYPMKCGEIQGVLFDYMARELGESRSALVREHVRKCPDCQRAAAEIQSTLDVLRAASAREEGIATTLSSDRRKRMLRALTHPVLDWMYVHHVCVSVAVALAVLLALTVVLRKTRMFRRAPEPPGPTLIIRADGTWGTEPEDATNTVDRTETTDP